MICLVEEEKSDDLKSMRKIHRVTGHTNEINLRHAYEGKMDEKVRKNIKKAVDSCKTHKKYKISQWSPNVVLTKATDFNEIIMLDLKQMKGKNILDMISWVPIQLITFIGTI